VEDLIVFGFEAFFAALSSAVTAAGLLLVLLFKRIPQRYFSLRFASVLMPKSLRRIRLDSYASSPNASTILTAEPPPSSTPAASSSSTKVEDSQPVELTFRESRGIGGEEKEGEDGGDSGR